MGPRCSFGHDVYLSTARTAEIALGKEVTFNTGCLIVASERIEIGDRVAIGEYVSIRDQVHRFTPGHGVKGQGFIVKPIRIGENTWIGRGVFIGPGTRIGADCIVGANSVVHGEFPSGVLIAGSPARVKKAIAPNSGSAEADESAMALDP
jgi:acetyltransferase-like isoleucine patch superfamily enzyme